MAKKRKASKLADDASRAATAVDPASLHVDDDNARVHSEENSSAIDASLREFGPGRSVVIDKDDRVIAGNGTLEAARKVGKRVVVVDGDGDTLVAVRRKDWTPEQARAYAIADNRTTDLSTFDFDILAGQLADLNESQPELLAAVGFDAAQLAQLADIEQQIGDLTDGDSFADFGPTATDDALPFRFGPYSGRVSRAVFDSFAIAYQRKQKASDDVTLDDVLTTWLKLRSVQTSS